MTSLDSALALRCGAKDVRATKELRTADEAARFVAFVGFQVRMSTVERAGLASYDTWL